MMWANRDEGATTQSLAEQNNTRAARVTSMVLVGALALLLAAFLWKDISSAQMSASMFGYPFQFDESEGMIVAETMLFDKGVAIYDRPTADLFIAAPYPPLFYLLAWPAQHLLGSEPSFKIG